MNKYGIWILFQAVKMFFQVQSLLLCKMPSHDLFLLGKYFLKNLFIFVANTFLISVPFWACIFIISQPQKLFWTHAKKVKSSFFSSRACFLSNTLNSECFGNAAFTILLPVLLMINNWVRGSCGCCPGARKYKWGVSSQV